MIVKKTDPVLFLFIFFGLIVLGSISYEILKVVALIKYVFG